MPIQEKDTMKTDDGDKEILEHVMADHEGTKEVRNEENTTTTSVKARYQEIDQESEDILEEASATNQSPPLLASPPLDNRTKRDS